jgi:hypothetical protein
MNSPRRCWQPAVLVVCVLTWPGNSYGQEVASTLDQLRVVLAPGSEIHVLTTDGRSIDGTFDRVSGSSLAFSVHGYERILTQDDILRIRQRRDDTLANGARHGFLAGATMGFLVGAALQGEVRSAALIPVSMGLYGGIGAGIGVGIDALIRHDRTIYDATASRHTVSVAPVVQSARKGVAVTVGF